MSDHKLNGDVEWSELDKFKRVLLGVLLTGADVIIPCTDDREAKLLRRRFYHMREKLNTFEREAADGVAFSLIGRRLRCSVKPNVPTGMDWSERIIIGAKPNVTDSQGDLPGGHRLDDAGGPGEL